MQTVAGPVFRFAPSPNGFLHLGHAYSALLNQELAREVGGRLILRLEDLDTSRCRATFARAIEEDLTWLGLVWEAPVRVQSEHLHDYGRALDRLLAAGLVYGSSASRGEIAAEVRRLEAETGTAWRRDPDGAPLFPRSSLGGKTLRQRPAAGLPIRLDMAAALNGGVALSWQEAGSGPEGQRGEIWADPAAWGDIVVARKEVAASYHLAVVVDDALQGVTTVVRGQDLFQATAVQRLLQHHLGIAPPLYHHHPLIRGGAREKLSKSLASKSLRALRAEGATVLDIRRAVGL